MSVMAEKFGTVNTQSLYESRVIQFDIDDVGRVEQFLLIFLDNVILTS